MAPTIQTAAVAAVDAVETFARTRTLADSSVARRSIRSLARLSGGTLPGPISAAWERARVMMADVAEFPAPRSLSAALVEVAVAIRSEFKLLPVPAAETATPQPKPRTRKESHGSRNHGTEQG